MVNKRAHVVLSEQLLKDIDALVGSRQRSSFITQAAEEKLIRLRQIEALKAATGAWKDKDHPELKQGSAKWVRKLRRESESRFRKTAQT
jgi:Arc/MetJ-type ribon-helix-helix transcriptional regulator